MNTYGRQFFLEHSAGVRRSAARIVPIVLEFLNPRSVVDVGCGEGAWLAAFQACGVSDILGLDGEYIDQDTLEIAPEFFRAVDLNEPLHLNRQFDLVVSLEVAEHLRPESADHFISSLTALGKVVLFSAAVPLQGGTAHLNEQWPDYWADRFFRQGYVAVDAIRPAIWEHADVDVWYAQNMLLYIHAETLPHYPLLERAYACSSNGILARVHPRLFTEFAQKKRQAEAEAKVHRRKAEHYIVEAAEHRAKAEYYIKEAEQFRRLADPRNMRLRDYIRAFPAILAGSLRRLVGISRQS